MIQYFYTSVMKQIQNIWAFLCTHRNVFFFLIIFVFFLFFHFYQLFLRADIGWDEIDVAQAAKSILVDKQFLLQGPPIKEDTGLYMGPLYYYFSTPFYFFTHLDPIASPIIAGVLSIFTFLTLFFVTKKLFGTNTALIAIFIDTFSFTLITYERTQNTWQLIAPVSYLLFFFLYKVITGKEKYILYLALMLGIAFQLDLTAIFYPVIILFTLPFFPRTKKTLWYTLLSLPILLIFFFPIFYTLFLTKHGSGSATNLFQSSFLGLHLRRVLQLTHDAFIQFIVIFQYNFLDYFDYLIPVVFGLLYYFQKPSKNRLLFIYLIALWIIIPWIILATYGGELTVAYFDLPRNIFIAMLAYFTVFLFQRKNIFITCLVVIFWLQYAVSNFQLFMKPYTGNLLPTEAAVKVNAQIHAAIPWQDHAFRSYLYYIYTLKN